jgi:methylenetetrahydrofolate dehydrogenase (NADP+)/methenyltetrahydrofolate cyclohydrolase/formyltetrahydrofolate synthetase
VGTEDGEDPSRGGYVLTEGGFGADMGMEKFCNIKCRVSGLTPDAVVIVATTRALKMHGGGPEVTPGKALHETYTQENLDILREGCKNLIKHIENSKKFGLKVLVGINKFTYGCSPCDTLLSIMFFYSTDTRAELTLVKEMAVAGGADAAIVSNHWAEGGAGARELAAALIACCETPSNFRFLYDLDLSIEEKINIICKDIYGADWIQLSDLARTQINTYTRQGYSALPSELWSPQAIFVPASLNVMFSLHGQDPILILARCIT